MNLAIIMYHYVRNVEETEFPKIHAISVARFREQIEKLKSEYTFISVYDLIKALNGEKEIPKNSCMLSFDDGLSDHFENVFPILRENDLSGVFFPITSVFEGSVVDANKLQFLLAKIDGEVLAEKFNGFLKNQSAEIEKKFRITDKAKIDSRYRFDNVLTANLKATMQIVPRDLRSVFLKKIFSEYMGDEKEFARRLYLSKEQIKEMADNGMVFGSHTHTHNRLDRLTKDEQFEELSRSKSILENILNKRINIVSYPYGNYNEDTVAIVKDLGYTIALGTKVGKNSENIDRFDIKRLNANDI